MLNAETRHKNQLAWWNLLPEKIQIKTNSIYNHVEKLRKTQTIYPPSKQVFAAFELTHPDDVKVVIIGQDPYHEENEAMGLAFSVQDGVKIPPSLRNIFTELQNDIGVIPPTSGNLTKWAENGVLLLNSVLTVNAHAANSHKYFEWQVLTREILKICLKSNRPIVYMCWGRQALDTLNSVIVESNNTLTNQIILKSSHPSPFSAYTTTAYTPAFMGSKQFSKANAWLSSQNIKPVDWTL